MGVPLLAFAAACGLLAGCAHRPEGPPIELLASGDARGCRFEAEGRLLAEGSQAEAEAMLAKATRRWKGRSVTILGGVEVPFKCFGMAMFVLQRAVGQGRVGFISEPPPEPD